MALPSTNVEQYTYGNYLQWPDDERWEILEGTPFNMSPAPSRLHQKVVVELVTQLSNQLENKECEVYVAPFDVRLPEEDEADEDILTVVQPDVVVVCDQDKLDDKGCRGAPDFVVEVLSPGTAARDLIDKSALYEKHGVKEYWTIHPIDQVVSVQILGENGSYLPLAFMAGKGEKPIATLPGLSIDFNRVFGIKEKVKVIEDT